MSGLKASQELMSKWRSAIRGDKKNDTGVSCDDGTEGEVQLDVIVAQINLIEETVESATSMKYPRETYNETEKQTNESRLAYVRKLMPAEDEKACYVLMRVAVEDQLGDVDRARESWLFIYSVPNRLSVRERMLYSSSLQGFKRDIEYKSHFVGTLDVHSKEEVVLANLEELLLSLSQPNPMTAEEINLSRQSVIQSHGRESIHGEVSNSSNVMRVHFKLDGEVVNQLKSFVGTKIDNEFQVLSLKVGHGETVLLHERNETMTSKNSSQELLVRNLITIYSCRSEAMYLEVYLKTFPDQSLPAIHLITSNKYHNEVGVPKTALVLLHCPDSSHVRSKMLHSSCLSSLSAIFAAQQIEIVILRTKIVQSYDDYDDNDVLEENIEYIKLSGEDEYLAKEQILSKPSFLKPKRAGRKGSSRLI